MRRKFINELPYDLVDLLRLEKRIVDSRSQAPNTGHPTLRIHSFTIEEELRGSGEGHARGHAKKQDSPASSTCAKTPDNHSQ